MHVSDFDKVFVLQTDASNNGVGAVLCREFDGELFPVAYASKKLLPRKRAYSVIECGGLFGEFASSKLTCVAVNLCYKLTFNL